MEIAEGRLVTENSRRVGGRGERISSRVAAELRPGRRGAPGERMEFCVNAGFVTVSPDPDTARTSAGQRLQHIPANAPTLPEDQGRVAARSRAAPHRPGPARLRLPDGRSARSVIAVNSPRRPPFPVRGRSDRARRGRNGPARVRLRARGGVDRSPRRPVCPTPGSVRRGGALTSPAPARPTQNSDEPETTAPSVPSDPPTPPCQAVPPRSPASSAISARSAPRSAGARRSSRGGRRWRSGCVRRSTGGRRARTCRAAPDPGWRGSSSGA